MREQVDAIFAQWQTERPDIDPSPVHIYGLIGRIQMQCTALIDEALAPFELTRGTYDVLTALRRAGAPYSLSPKQIAQSLLLVRRRPDQPAQQAGSAELPRRGCRSRMIAARYVFSSPRRARP